METIRLDRNIARGKITAICIQNFKTSNITSNLHDRDLFTYIVRSKLQLVPRLQQLYGAIENMDLYIGGLLERKDGDAMVGPTFKCLVGDQFRRIRMGDRFWYEEPNQAGSFTIGNHIDSYLFTSFIRILRNIMKPKHISTYCSIS